MEKSAGSKFSHKKAMFVAGRSQDGGPEEWQTKIFSERNVGGGLWGFYGWRLLIIWGYLLVVINRGRGLVKIIGLFYVDKWC